MEKKTREEQEMGGIICTVSSSYKQTRHCLRFVKRKERLLMSYKSQQDGSTQQSRDFIIIGPCNRLIFPKIKITMLVLVSMQAVNGTRLSKVRLDHDE